LQTDTYFAVCYASISGNSSDPSWRDSYIRLYMSKVATISGSHLEHVTYGTISRISPVELTYNGTHEENRWISLVDDTLNMEYASTKDSDGAPILKYWSPCGNSTTAAADSDEMHSGALQAGTSSRAFQLNSAGLSDSATFAVCYCEDLVCDATTTWTDSGIRVRVSKIKAVSHWLRADTADTSTPIVTWMGSLASGNGANYVSLVDTTRNNNNPCISQADVKASPGLHHSGPLAPITGTKNVAFSQIWNMDITKLYAVCYSEDFSSSIDTSWKDSNIRIRLIHTKSKVRQISFLPYSAKSGLSDTTFVV